MQQAKSPREKLELFYRFWALKECHIKATGEGLVEDLRSIEFELTTEPDREEVSPAGFFGTTDLDF